MGTQTEILPPLKTWSHLAGKRRRPSEYEIVSVNLHGNKSYLNERAPFELSEDLAMNNWYRRYRDETRLTHADWNAFRDPDETTYRSYNILQDDQETYVDGLFDEFSSRQSDEKLTKDWVKVLARCYTPSRYPLHALQMASSYLGHISPASTITNCCFFQAADCLRLVSHTAYRTRELSNSFPNGGFVTGELSAWEKDSCWQGFRELLERLLASYDWSDSFAGLCLVAKPMVDECLLRQLGAAARENGDDLLGMLTDAQLRDSDRAKRWASALAKDLLTQNGNRETLQQSIDKWMKYASAAAGNYCEAIQFGEGASGAIAKVREFHALCGLA